MSAEEFVDLKEKKNQNYENSSALISNVMKTF